MKKLITLFVACAMLLALSLSLTSCGGGDPEPKVKLIDIKLTEEEYAFAVNKNDPTLLATVNELLAEMTADGTFEAIVNKYFSGEGEKTGYAQVAEDPSKNQLVVATNAAFAPFEYMEGDKYYGIDIEIMGKLAEKLGAELVIKNMSFNAVVNSVQQGLCDIAAAGLTVTPERSEIVNFSNAYYQASQMIIVKNGDTTFDNCKTAADVEAILAALSADTTIGVQTGTTGELYVIGDEDWGFAGYSVECKGYESGALAVQDMLNGNLAMVIIDEGPAGMIVSSVNE